ncbi:MAG: hypothetical protein ACXVJE_19490 [Mucilaginibacter sp.]
MKKTVLIGLIALTSATSFAQKHDTTKKTIPKTDTAKKVIAKPDTMMMVFNKPTATEVAKAIQSGYISIPWAESISAKQATEAKMIFEFFLRTIYKKWPDLQPKQ